MSFFSQSVYISSHGQSHGMFKHTPHIYVWYNESTLAYLEWVVQLIRKPASQGTWKQVYGLTKERQPTSWRLAETISPSLKLRAQEAICFSWLAAWTDWGCRGVFILIRYELTVGSAWWLKQLDFTKLQQLNSQIIIIGLRPVCHSSPMYIGC